MWIPLCVSLCVINYAFQLTSLIRNTVSGSQDNKWFLWVCHMAVGSLRRCMWVAIRQDLQAGSKPTAVEASGVAARGGYSYTWAWSRGGGGTPILGHGREFMRWWPHFGDFLSNWVPILYLNMTQLPPFLQKNLVVSITFSSRDTRTYSWSIFSPKCII